MDEELRVLLLEDEPTDAEFAETALRDAGLRFTALRVDTQEAFLRAIEEFRPDIILADYRLPGFDGLAALRLAHERAPAVPVIIVSGTLGDELAVQLLREGARDYVLKDRLVRLAPAVRRALDDVRAEEARRRNEEQLRIQLDELRRFQRLTIGRELRMKELKEENRRLREALAKARGG